jgi:Uma2 family endonuclease
MSAYVEFRGEGVVLIPPFQMKLPHSGREPDVIYLSPAHRNRFLSTYIAGPADLVVEVVSPESVERDRVTKFAEYREGGVPEYWLLDPDTERAEFYQLDDHGAYQVIAPDADGVYRSAVLPGFWLKVAWLWQDPRPTQQTVLYAMLGKPYADFLREQTPEGGQ